MSNVILEQARQRIDAEINTLHERIRSLLSYRNTFTLIHALPAEVMTQIFKCLQLLFRGKLELCGSEGASLPKWMHVTQVSRHWRDIAMNSKALCSTLLTHDLDYSSKMLGLSRSTALSLIDTMDLNAERKWQDPKLQELVLAALPRVRSLALNRGSAPFLLPHLTNLDPALEELLLWGWDTFCPKLFPPSLKYLQLYHCSFGAYEDRLLRMSNMVELKFIARDESIKLKVDTLLNILDAMPRLISLELSGVLGSASTQMNRVAPTRPKLQFLELCNPPDPIIELLPWLTFAPRFNLAITLLTTHTVTSWLPPLLDRVAQHLKESSMVLRRAKIIWDPKGSVGSCPAMIFSEDFEEEPCFQLIYRAIPNLGLVETWLKSVEVLPIQNVQSLTTNAPLGPYSSYWSNRSWDRVRQLTLQNDLASSKFLKDLTTSSAVGSVLLWSLEELSVSRISFGRNLKARLHAVFTARKNHGKKLRKLAFHDCSVSEDSIRQFAKVVDVVEQHGETNPKNTILVT